MAVVDGDGRPNADQAAIVLRILPTFIQTWLIYGLRLLALAARLEIPPEKIRFAQGLCARFIDEFTHTLEQSQPLHDVNC